MKEVIRRLEKALREDKAAICRREGQLAAMKGGDLRDNPYCNPLSAEWINWNAGYTEEWAKDKFITPTSAPSCGKRWPVGEGHP